MPKAKKPIKKTTSAPQMSKFNSFQSYAKERFHVLKTRSIVQVEKKRAWFKAIPGWITSRPVAIKTWRAADRKKRKYRTFHLQKKLKPEPRYIPSSVGLLKASGKFLYQHKRIFLTIIAIHAVIYVVLLRGVNPLNITTIQDAVKSVLGDSSRTSLQGNLATLSAVLSSSTSTQTNATLFTVSTILMSLVYIWAIRQLHATKEIRARDAYYQGMTPLVPTVLVLFVASLQLIPFAVASFVYSIARGGGLFANGFEDLSIFIIALFVALLSFYWLTSTIIALYIVTLPGMWPMRALKAAKQTIKFQRLTVFRRVLALPIIIGVAYLILLLIAIRLFPSRVFLIVETLQLLLLPLIHTYLYKLYRSFL